LQEYLSVSVYGEMHDEWKKIRGLTLRRERTDTDGSGETVWVSPYTVRTNE